MCRRMNQSTQATPLEVGMGRADMSSLEARPVVRYMGREPVMVKNTISGLRAERYFLCFLV